MGKYRTIRVMLRKLFKNIIFGLTVLGTTEKKANLSCIQELILAGAKANP